MSVRESSTSTVDVEVSVGNPTVEHIRGVLRLFRSVTRTPNLHKCKSSSSKSSTDRDGDRDEEGRVSEGFGGGALTQKADKEKIGKLPLERSKTLCLLGVPEHMAPSEMFQFFGAFLKTIYRIRFVRQDESSLQKALASHSRGSPTSQKKLEVKREEEEATPTTKTKTKTLSSHTVSNSKTYTSCVLEFRTQQAADEFYATYDGKLYSSLEHDICRCIFVERVFLDEDGGNTASERESEQRDDVLETMSEISSATAAETEMPSCPVCLERLDEHITGIATTMCNHSFHPECLKKCTMTSCPVCRYSQMGFLDEEERSQCHACNAHEDLWICIVCGEVGCGRYAGGHARTHWMETGHCYAMELQSQRVWDYVNDEYVHRLIRSKVDGQHYLVEVPANGEVEPYLDSQHANYSSREEGGLGFSLGGGLSGESDSTKKGWEKNRDVILTSKIEAITLEYNHLLTVQLDSQSKYFEEQLQEMRQKLSVGQEDVLKNQEMADAALSRARHLESSKRISEKKMAMYCSKIEETEKENHFLRQLNESLLRDKKKWQEELQRLKEGTSEKDSLIKDLKEQVRDIISHLEAKNVVSEEMVGASLSLPDEASSSSSTGRNATHSRLLKKMKDKRKE